MQQTDTGMVQQLEEMEERMQEPFTSRGGTVIAKMTNSRSMGAAIGASVGKSVTEIQISGGTVTAETTWNGAGI